MFTSDVSARGMDFPDVSLVIQVPSPNFSGFIIFFLRRLSLVFQTPFTIYF